MPKKIPGRAKQKPMGRPASQKSSKVPGTAKYREAAGYYDKKSPYYHRRGEIGGPIRYEGDRAGGKTYRPYNELGDMRPGLSANRSEYDESRSAKDSVAARNVAAGRRMREKALGQIGASAKATQLAAGGKPKVWIAPSKQVVIARAYKENAKKAGAKKAAAKNKYR